MTSTTHAAEPDRLPGDYGRWLAAHGYTRALICVWMCQARARDFGDHRSVEGLVLEEGVFYLATVTTLQPLEAIETIDLGEGVWVTARLCQQPCCCLLGEVAPEFDAGLVKDVSLVMN